MDQQALLSFFKETGFGEPLFSWFGSFIDSRKQSVKIHGVTPDLLLITGQLFSLLFILFINSVVNRVLKHVRLLAFADDI